MAKSAALRVDVVSRTQILWKGHASYVSVPAVDGRLGILKGRQPILTVLDPGDVEIKTEDGKTVSVTVDGGFASVDSNHVTIVAEGGKLSSK